jgi:predicted anti-sigma-YlaC factor YlaD
MTCEELLKSLNDYLDDESVLALYREFAEHLAQCNPCQVVVDNLRKTIRLYQAGEPFPMPPEFQERFRQALREKWKQKFPQASI